LRSVTIELLRFKLIERIFPVC